MPKKSLDYTEADERAETEARKREIQACDRLLALLTEHHPEQLADTLLEAAE